MMKESMSEIAQNISISSSVETTMYGKPQNRFTPLKKASNEAGDKIKVTGDDNLKPPSANTSLTGFTWLGPFSAIITATLASLCCVAPFVLVSLGITGAWIGSLRAFEFYRPIFILFTIGFLFAGFYKVYWKKTESCKPGSLCADPQTKIDKIMLWGATFFVVFLMILPYLIGWLA